VALTDWGLVLIALFQGSVGNREHSLSHLFSQHILTNPRLILSRPALVAPLIEQVRYILDSYFLVTAWTIHLDLIPMEERYDVPELEVTFVE
jgi:hypothetical protein